MFSIILILLNYIWIIIPEIVFASNFFITPIPKYSTLSEYIEVSYIRKIIHIIAILLKTYFCKIIISKVITLLSLLTLCSLNNKISYLLHNGSAAIFIFSNYGFLWFIFIKFILIQNLIVYGYDNIFIITLSYYIELAMFITASLYHN